MEIGGRERDRFGRQQRRRGGETRIVPQAFGVATLYLDTSDKTRGQAALSSLPNYRLALPGLGRQNSCCNGMTNLDNRASLRKPQWYVQSAQILHRNRPFVVPFIAGLFLLELSHIVELPLRPVSITALWLGQCLLVFAAARRLHSAGWVNRRKVLTTSLWILNAATSAMLATSALDRYRSYRDPNTWLLLESRPIKSAKAPLLTGDGYFLLDLSPDSDLIPKKAGLEESGDAMRRLEEQAKLSGEAYTDYAMVCRLINAGARRLAIQLPVTVSYEGIWNKDLAVRTPRDIRIPIQPLNPGESFKVIIFSTDSQRYSSFTFPDTIPVQWDDSGQVHPLRINYEGDNKTYSLMASYIVVSGVRVEPTPAPTSEPSNPSKPAHLDARPHFH
jgi:hypothetical protein